MNTRKIKLLKNSVKIAVQPARQQKFASAGMDAVPYHSRPYFYQVQGMPQAWKNYAKSLPRSAMFKREDFPKWMQPGSPFYTLGSGVLMLQNYFRPRPAPVSQTGLGSLAPRLMSMAPSAMDILNNPKKPKYKPEDYDYIDRVASLAEEIENYY